MGLDVNAPCRDCMNREVGCHAVCERYIGYTEERKEIMNKVYACKHKEKEYMDMRRNAVMRALRNRGKKAT